jgi:hypothetical protein
MVDEGEEERESEQEKESEREGGELERLKWGNERWGIYIDQ